MEGRFREPEFLLAANASRIGNLDFRFSLEDHEPTLGPPHFNDLAQIIQAALKLTAGETGETPLLKLLRQGSSMGDARPKRTVEWQDALWIAKFPVREDTLNIPRIEFATMELALRCGISVPELKIVSVGENDIFFEDHFHFSVGYRAMDHESASCGFKAGLCEPDSYGRGWRTN